MLLVFRHSGRYSANRFTIDDVIGSLAGQREILRVAAMALPQLDDAVTVQDIQFVVERIEAGSLVWDILVEVQARYQRQIDDVVIEGIEDMFGADIPAEYEALVSLLSVAVVYMVARYAYERVVRGSGASQPSVHISGENNVVIQNVARVVNQSPESVAAALDRAVPPARRRQLVSRVADFLRPARQEPGSVIEVAGAPTIPAEAIREFPGDAALEAVDDSSNLDVEDAILEIRAMDRDRSKTGWSARIWRDDRFPRRLPMDLYPTVNAEALAMRHFVRANLIIEGERTPGGGFRPKRIHLISYEPTAAPDP